jgi:hypothetical protein
LNFAASDRDARRRKKIHLLAEFDEMTSVSLLFGKALGS